MNKRKLDDTKPYNQEQIKRESFQWAKPLFKLFKQDKDAKYWKVEAHFPVSSMNRNIYSRDEIAFGISGLPGKHVDLSHYYGQLDATGKQLPNWTIPEVSISAAAFENDAAECILRVQNNAVDAKGRNVNAAIESGEIDHVSIEADAPESYPTDEGTQVKGLSYTGLALLDQDSLPGIPLTRLMPLESLRESIFAEVENPILKEDKKTSNTIDEKKYQEMTLKQVEDELLKAINQRIEVARKLYPREEPKAADPKPAELEAELQVLDLKVNALQNVLQLKYAALATAENLAQEAGSLKKLADEKQANVDAQKEIDKLTEDLRKTTDELNDAKAEVAKLKKAKTQSEARITSVFEKIQQEKDERIDNLEKANKELETKVANFEAKNAGLLEKSNSYLKQLEDESEKRATADQRAINEMKQTNIVKEENAQLAQENADLTRKQSQLTQKVADLSKKLYAAEKELSSTKESLGDVSRKYRKIRRVVIKT